MNSPRPQRLKKNPSQSDFPACKNAPLPLKTKRETALVPFQQQRSIEFTGLFERWSISTHSQAGVFLLRLIGGSCDPIRCGIWVSEPQDACFDKIEEKIRLEVLA
jgi:hypothetical protein